MTGTDTGVGKTAVACALLRAFAGAGKSAVGMKPVAAGSEAGHRADVEALAGASTVRVPVDLANPYAFEPAIAPHIAADLAGVRIEIETIARAYAGLSRRAEVVVVEGVGGFLVPLNARETGADLAKRLALPVVLVVGMRLGCLNHALLTATAIRAAGLPLAGWVANSATHEMPAFEANVATLDERIDAPRLGLLPWLGAQPDVAVAASHLDLSLLPGMPHARV